MANQSSNNNNGGGGGNICHVMPCSIDENLTAPIAQYFKPTPLPDAALPKMTKQHGAPDDDDNDDCNNKYTTKNDVTIMAAQFRGRGLLCAVDSPTASSKTEHGTTSSFVEEGASPPHTPLSKLPSNIIGVALSQSTTNRTAAGISTQSSKANNNSKDDNTPMQSLKVTETFNEIYNWNHEHDVSKVTRERHGNEKYGLNAVLGWCELAHAVSILCTKYYVYCCL